MKVPEAIRAQFYIRELNTASSQIVEVLRYHKIPSRVIDSLMEQLHSNIARSLDEIILPAVVSMVHSASASLRSETESERYREVFLNGTTWTRRAMDFASTYGHLFSQIEIYCDSAARQICSCIGNLARLQSARFAPQSLVRLKILSADRHASTWLPLLLTFDSGESVVYKTGDHGYYRVVEKFLNLLSLPENLEVRIPNSQIFTDFALVEYIAEMPPSDLKEAEALYRNFGALIAVMDSINYCDGHFENVVRHGAYPMIVDLETAFHSFNPPSEIGDERSILYTGLIQKPPKREVDEGISAALQMPSSIIQEMGRPFAVNDRSSNIQLRFRGIIEVAAGFDESGVREKFQVHDHVDSVIQGYTATYESNARQKHKVLAKSDLWNEVATTRFRQVIRTTLYYVHLLRRSQMADISSSSTKIMDWLGAGLSENPVLAPYELYELHQGRIPIFFHRAGSKNLLDGHGGIYRSFLSSPSVEDVRFRWQHIDESYELKQVELLRNNLTTNLEYSDASTP